MSGGGSIALGKSVRCIASDYEGIVVARCEYISGVTEYGVRAKSKEGVRPHIEYIEESLLEVIGDGITVAPIIRRAGFYSESPSQ